ncbi:MAG: hypothetical protein SGI88_19425 [Candidatus Hydrogenedentes bacterium]|nr:hypothetical protein [Candidatus Hydrogenedentota bacterium]
MGVDGSPPSLVTTPFTDNFDNHIDIYLEAPAVWQTREFIEWQKNGVLFGTDLVVEYETGTSPVTFQAMYGPPSVSLTVTSSPNENIEFLNEDIYPLTTPYERVFHDETPYDAIVRAPVSHEGKPFARWILNGEVHSTFHIAYLTMDQNHTLEAQYGTGTIKCKIQPKGARKKARWRIDGGPWMRRGETATGVLVGEHLIEWNDVPGFSTPKDRTVPVLDGNTHTIRGRYFPNK